MFSSRALFCFNQSFFGSRGRLVQVFAKRARAEDVVRGVDLFVRLMAGRVFGQLSGSLSKSGVDGCDLAHRVCTVVAAVSRHW